MAQHNDRTEHNPMGCRQSKRATCAGVALVVGFVVVALAIFLHVRSSGFNLGLFGSWRLCAGITELSRHTSLEFPPSAKLLNFRHNWSGSLNVIQAEVEMYPADVDGFLQSLGEPKWISREHRFSNVTNRAGDPGDRSWWNPDAARDFVAVEVHLPLKQYAQFHTVWLLINLDDPDRAVVYVYWTGE